MSARVPRPAARLLVVDHDLRILLFRFVPNQGAPFWATPGGAVDPGESYPAAARRELFEETGFVCDPGPEIAQRIVDLTTVEGVDVTADERYFLVRTETTEISDAGHTELERRVMTTHRWWTLAELRAPDEVVYPEDIADMMMAALAG